LLLLLLLLQAVQHASVDALSAAAASRNSMHAHMCCLYPLAIALEALYYSTSSTAATAAAALSPAPAPALRQHYQSCWTTGQLIQFTKRPDSTGFAAFAVYAQQHYNCRLCCAQPCYFVTFRLHHLLHHDAEDPIGSMCLADLHSGSTAHANVLQCWVIAALLVTLDPARSSELTGSATGGDEPHSPTAELDALHKNCRPMDCLSKSAVHWLAIML
jgi:hypothetical protein